MVADIESLGEKIVSDEWMDYVREILSASGSDQNVDIVSQIFSHCVFRSETTKYIPGTDK
jgi:hypothetical protein